MKTAIIGAGIAGLYLASRISRKSQVTVFERKKEIGNQACSGLFSRRILDHIPDSENLIENKIKYAFIHFPKKTLRLDFSKEFLVMNHSELDKLVSSKLEAEIILGCDIKKIPEGYDRIIGADGPLSFIRNELGLRNPLFKLGILGLQKKESYDDFVETWPIKKGGFLWKIPRGKNTEYGIMADKENARVVFEEFLSKRGIVLNDLISKLIPQGLVLPSDGRITLAGDASGLTKPWSGGGVIWQLKAADILAECFPDFKKYAKIVKREFFFKILAGRIASRAVYFSGFNIPWIIPPRNLIEPDFLIKKSGERRF